MKFMCLCTPEIRTPFCGKIGCQWPNEKVEYGNDEKVANEIVNHFFELGARIGKSDYDFVLSQIRNRKQDKAV